MVEQKASNSGPDRRNDGNAAGPDTDSSAFLVEWVGLPHNSQPIGQDQSFSQALKEAGGQHEGKTISETREQGCEKKQCDPHQKYIAAAIAIPQGTACHRNGRKRQKFGIQSPLDVGFREMKAVSDRR
jgi:hypothetical protein